MAQARRTPTVQNKSVSKRKRFGEEVSGGLIIVRSNDVPLPSKPASQPPPPTGRRSPAPIPPASQPVPSTSARPPSRTGPPPAQPPPTKKRRTSVEPNGVGVSSFAAGSSAPVREPHVDEDIARMDDEARSLRRVSRSASAGVVNPEFVVPTPGASPSATREKTPLPRKTKPRARGSAAPEYEEDDRRGRDVARAGPSNHRRKSSLSARGKRASSSYQQTGIITHPHPTVPAGSFYKHIDGEQPDAARLAQLLIWCSSRAAAKKPDPPDKGPPLPPLSAKGAEVMQAVQAGVLRALAERRVDTAPSRPLSKPPADKPESAQNVFNRQQVARFKADIDRSKHEDAAWAQVGAYYDAHQTNVLSALTTRARDKGKARADIRPGDLPTRFVGADGLALAQGVMREHEALLARDSSSETERSPLDARLADLEYKIDVLHTRVNEQLAAARDAKRELTARFAELSLASRSTPAALPHRPHTAYPPPAPADPEDDDAPAPAPTDPRSLLHALAKHEHVRAQRAPETIRPGVRSVARDIQRAADAGAGLVPPATPRRGGGGMVGGTPATVRRAPGTPGRLR